MMKFQIYKNDRDQFCWRLTNRNHKIIANSAQCYRSRDDCLEAIRLVKHSSSAQLEDQAWAAA